MRQVVIALSTAGALAFGSIATPMPGWAQTSSGPGTRPIAGTGQAANPAGSQRGLPESVVHGAPRAGELNIFQRNLMNPTPSIARADLEACSQLKTARPLEGADLAAGDLARLLEGTWIRELTWNGIFVETESALYFQFENRNFDDPAYSTNFTAMMYDQSNTGKRGPWATRAADIRTNPKEHSQLTTLTFVDCVHNIVDKYYKVSNETQLRGLDDFVDSASDLLRSGVARDRDGKPGSGLAAVWDQLTRSRLFEPSYIQDVQRSLGIDVQRSARGPLTEVTTPSVGGAYFQGTLKNAAVSGYQGITQGVTLDMRGDYRGAHVGAGDGQRVRFEGREAAQFIREGNSLVSSQRPVGARGVLAGEIPQGWMTDCADFFGLPNPVIWQRVVLQRGAL